MSICVHPWLNCFLHFARDDSGEAQHHSRPNYWLGKSEPEAYAWATFVKDGKTAWTGVRNLHRPAQSARDEEGRHGILLSQQRGQRGCRRGASDQRSISRCDGGEGDWSCVDLKPLKAFAKPVTLVDM